MATPMVMSSINMININIVLSLEMKEVARTVEVFKPFSLANS